MPPIATSGFRVSCRAARKKIDPHDRIGIGLRGRRKDGPHGNIIRRSGIGRAQLLQVVCRNAHPARRAANAARVFHREIVLPDVHASRVGHRRDVRAIVDDQAHAARRKKSPPTPSPGNRRAPPRPVCPEAASIGRPRSDKVSATRVRGERCKVWIKDRVKGWEQPQPLRNRIATDERLSRTGYYFTFTAVSRSRKWVSNLPAMKSGSARIRLCSGMVVLIPSTTNPSSAPCIRAMASARSRP